MTITLTIIKPILNELKQELQELYSDRLVKLIHLVPTLEAKPILTQILTY